MRIIDTSKSRLKVPPARLVLMLNREAHQHRHEEAIGEHKMTLGVLATSRNLHGLEAEAHAAIRFPRCR